MLYDATYSDVSCVVKKIFMPKGGQKGITYSVSASGPIKKYANKYGCVLVSTFDTEPLFAEGQEIIANLGIKKNGDFTNAYFITNQEKTESEPSIEQKGNEEIDLLDPVCCENQDAPYDGGITIEDKKAIVKFIASEAAQLAPEGQQAFMNPAFKYLTI